MKLEKWHWVILGILIIGGIWYFGLRTEDITSAQGIPTKGETISVSCYNKDKQLISCGTPSTGAIYNGAPGIFFVRYMFRMDNGNVAGNVNLNGYIKTLTCKLSGVSNAECEKPFTTTSIVGTGNVLAVNKGSCGIWNVDTTYSGTCAPKKIGTTGLIDLQKLTSGTYNIDVQICANDQNTGSGLAEVCKSATTSFTTTQEGIDFTVGITNI